jgi:anti-sigma-K factor RskA
MSAHDTLLDDVAAYALGVLPADEAHRVRDHLRTCEECRAEYAELRPAVQAVARSAESCADERSGAVVASPLLKKRIMDQVRSEASQRRVNVAEMRAVRPIVWPAYAVAAACLAIALVTGIVNISTNAELHRMQGEIAQMSAHSTLLTREVTAQRTMIADLLSPDSQHYTVAGGEVIRHGKRLYLAMDALPAPPKGKVYQAWILRTGAIKVAPSVTFVPNTSGVAVVPIPADASMLAAVAVSIEPEGGSKQPTSTPTFLQKLS